VIDDVVELLTEVRVLVADVVCMLETLEVRVVDEATLLLVRRTGRLPIGIAPLTEAMVPLMFW
jgi:hypothetical protein